MLAVYKMVDLAAKNDKLSDDTFAVAFEKKCVGANIDAVSYTHLDVYKRQAILTDLVLYVNIIQVLF